MKKTFVSRAFFVITLLLVPYSALGSIRPYWAKRCISEPRYDRNCLTSFDVALMGGATKKGRNGSKHKTDTLNIYGLHEMRKLGEGVQNLDPLNIDDNILITLRNKNANGNFGKLRFTGKFKYIGAEFSMTQNLCNGFFIQSIFPLNRVEITNISYVDESPSTGVPASTDADWKQFLARFDNILARHNLTKNNTKETSFGDAMYLAGWTYNNDSVEYLDFLDVTIKAGVSIPTARQVNTTKAFSLTSGNNGHVGIPVSFDMALGMYEWFTWGMHVGGQFFLKCDGNFRMKTYTGQNGFIKLAQGPAREDLGNIWNIGSYLKADHIAGGFSLAVGYNYSAQETTTLSPYNTTSGDTQIFTSSIVNTDDMLKKWRMHAISIMADYDFAEEGKSWNPKIGVFYNQPVAGKRIFNTKTFGGNAGLNITWNF